MYWMTRKFPSIVSLMARVNETSFSQMEWSPWRLNQNPRENLQDVPVKDLRHWFISASFHGGAWRNVNAALVGHKCDLISLLMPLSCQEGTLWTHPWKVRGNSGFTSWGYAVSTKTRCCDAVLSAEDGPRYRACCPFTGMDTSGKCG